jgi:hypothetical protein
MAHVHHETSEEKKRSLNLWLLFVVVLVLIAAVAVVLVVVLQDDDDSSSTNTSTSQASSTPTTPEQYAKALYADWKAADRTAAAQVASPEAVEQLFQFPYEPLPTGDGSSVDPYRFTGCEGAAGSVVCTYTGEDDAQIVMTVRNTTGGLPVLVVEVQRQGG